MTFVPVGPVRIRPPAAWKKEWESLSSRKAGGSKPSERTRRQISGPAQAPAASVGPSIPSVPRLRTSQSRPCDANRRIQKRAELQERGQHEFLVAAAPPLPLYANGVFAAADATQRPASRHPRRRRIRQVRYGGSGGDPGLAGLGPAFHEHFEPQAFGGPARGFHGIGVAADDECPDPGENPIARFGGFRNPPGRSLLETGEHGWKIRLRRSR